MPSSDAAIPLYVYQADWVKDDGRFKMGMWARQTGKSFSTALEAVLDAVSGPYLWVLLSRGERQSKELMEKVRMHSQAISAVMDNIEGEWSGDATFKMLECRYPSGGRILGLPANPDTARGFSANVVLDEFAFHQDSRKIWTALYPSITRGYKIRVISTPNGRSGMFYDLWTGDNLYTKHRVTIYDAAAQGLPVNIEELKAGINDPDTWAQEYECEFVDEAAALLTFEMIAGCESESCLWDDFSAEPRIPPGAGNSELFLGMDIGRKKDLSVIWLAEKVEDVLFTRKVNVLFRTPFRDQRELLFSYLPMVRRACIDATGLGMQLAEEAQEKFGETKVEAVTFTSAVKEDLAVTMMRAFQDKRVRVPIDRDVRSDLHSVRKYVTVAGNVRYDADRTEATGHADRFWSLALALHAAAAPSYQIEFQTTGVKRTFSGMRNYL